MLEDDALDVFSEVLEELEDGPGLGCTSPAHLLAVLMRKAMPVQLK